MSAAPTPQRQFLGNLLEQAREFRHEALDDLRDALGMVESDAFEGADRRLFDAAAELLDEGKVPTPAAVRTLKLPGFTAEHAAHYLDAAGQLGEWRSYVEAVTAHYEQRVLTGGLTAALAALQKGQRDEARTLAAQALDEAPSRGSYAAEYVTDFGLPDAYEPRVPMPWDRLTEALGGGLGVEGNAVMSLWLGDSGMGKSTLAQQVVLHLLTLGHHVLYCFGEGRRGDITRELSRLQADLGYDELRYGLDRGVRRILDKQAQAAAALAALPGKLAVHDDEFDGQDVRDLARRYRRQLRKALEAGEAPEGAKLFVVIDNIDSAITFDNRRFSREDQAYEYEAKRFEQAAKREGYHVMVLSQTNDEGRKRNGPPEKSDIARAKALMNRAAFIVSIHRPITEADREHTDRDGNPGRRARTWIAVRKARGGWTGDRGELEFATDPRTGRWSDPQQPPF